MEQFVWCERWRPTTIDECILPSAIRATAKSFVAQGDLPNMILAGNPGMGKTTLASAMCRELGVDPMFINGSEENGIDTLRTKIKDFASALSLDGKRRYIIIDEADYLSAAAQPALRGIIEEMAKNCGFILTCNYANRLIPALHSRCTVIQFAIPAEEKKKLMLATTDRLMAILKEEQIQAEEKLVIQLVKRYWPDMRRMLNEMQRACASGVLTPAVLGQSADVEFGPLWDALKTRNYGQARQWIGQNADIDSPRFYRAVFDWLHDAAKPQTLPASIVLLADYQYRAAFVADQHVHLSALCLELMNAVEWK